VGSRLILTCSRNLTLFLLITIDIYIVLIKKIKKTRNFNFAGVRVDRTRRSATGLVLQKYDPHPLGSKTLASPFRGPVLARVARLAHPWPTRGRLGWPGGLYKIGHRAIEAETYTPWFEPLTNASMGPFAGRPNPNGPLISSYSLILLFPTPVERSSGEYRFLLRFCARSGRVILISSPEKRAHLPIRDVPKRGRLRDRT
jgi:hypothetical protein